MIIYMCIYTNSQFALTYEKTRDNSYPQRFSSFAFLLMNNMRQQFHNDNDTNHESEFEVSINNHCQQVRNLFRSGLKRVLWSVKVRSKSGGVNSGRGISHQLHGHSTGNYLWHFAELDLFDNWRAGECFNRRKFRSQTSVNMDRWKAEMGRVREEKRRED